MVFFAAPSPVDSTTLPFRRSRIKHVWTGWDGSLWNLTDHSGTSGVFLMDQDVDGLKMPEFERFTETSVTRHGATLRGYQVKPRTAVWPLFLYHDASSEEWVRYDRAFWRTMHPMRSGVWSVTAPGCEARHLRCTFASDEPSYPRDPASAMWARYAVELVADDPFWTSTPLVGEFRSGKPVNWLGGGPVDQPGAGTPLVIGANSTTTTATITNNGDLEGWIKWEAHGPIDPGMRLGIGNRVAVIDKAVPEGSVLTLDTDPNDQQIFINGTEFIPAARPLYAAIPDGGSSPIVVDMHGGGYVRAKLTPRFFRAW